MILKEYTLEEIVKLTSTRAILQADFPKIGYIAYCQDRPIAAGFIRSIEGNVGLIGEYITDPAATSEQRHEALDLITMKLLSEAKEIGLTEVIALTLEPTIADRALNHGFVRQNHILLTKTV